VALQTRRDFLPVEICARIILACAENSVSGTFNIGAGFPIGCGDLAQWIIEGYGKGEIVATEDRVRDEFYLNTEKWQSNFGPLIDREGLRQRCIELGQLLK
jgi:dTDP-4-dehydrorhamnose reductase/UDP-glucose 4-epimerase